jgi:hypothetical protein
MASKQPRLGHAMAGNDIDAPGTEHGIEGSCELPIEVSDQKADGRLALVSSHMS